MGVYTLTRPSCSTITQSQLPNFVCSKILTIMKGRSSTICSFRCLCKEFGFWLIETALDSICILYSVSLPYVMLFL